MPDLLIELFSEEIPARMQAKAADDLKRLVTNGIVEAGLTYAGAAAFATPRRLTLAVEGMTAASPTTREERKGPRTDAPDAAVEGFCKSAGVAREALEARDDKKGQVWFATIVKPGRPAREIVAEVLTDTVRGFPWPKSMRWGAGELRWVRPLHSILCLVTDEAGSDVVPVEIGPVAAGRTTEGHRFMAPEPFTVASFDDYVAKLKRAKVLLDPAERAEQIRHDAANLAFAQGLEVVEDPGLLAEVAGLVEWPVALMGEIAPRFRHLPAEVLQTSMRTHQKFFAVRDAGGAITHFVTVANRETADQGATILAGNRKVLAARLSDAAFFWDRDLAEAKAGMGNWLDGLGSVTFHARLGSQKERIDRIAALARELAPLVGADPDLAEQAARVAKADLRSDMVGEFPELQGIMGRYYALEAGMPAEVAEACAEHYSPLGPSDAVPKAPVSVAVALADKIDLLTGFWAIDEKPTGSKDPFALRRAALGVIRLVLENGVRLQIDRLFDAQVLRHQVGDPGEPEQAAQFGAILGATVRSGMYGAETRELVAAAAAAAPSWHDRVDPHDPAISDDLLAFFHDRLKVFLRDQGIRHDVIDAVLAMPGKCDLVLLVRRAEALSALLASEDGANLLQGFKRANNILTQAEAADGVEYSFGPDAKLAKVDAERALFAALDREGRAISSAIEAEDFASAMRGMASLRAPIDAFFEAVQVNAENQVIRRNRLNLLHLIRATCLKVADLTRLQG